MLTVALEKLKEVAAALGAGGVAFSIYTASGLPVPATIGQVETRIAAVNETIKGVRVDGLEGRRSIIMLTKTSLRNEKGAIERTLGALDMAARVTMNRRIGEIGDQLKDLEEQDAEVRAKMNALKSK
jgi:hypothetical protein